MASRSTRGRRGWLRVAALLVLLAAVLLPSLSPAPAAADTGSGGGYRVPITIVERSGTDLSDYPVEIVLNTSNFDGWGNISPDGSDIYFLDSSGSPLYYWLDSITNIYNETPLPRGDRNPGVYWKYTTSTPPSDWYTPGFDDSSWATAEAPIGDTGPYRTKLDFTDLYVRKNITIPGSIDGIPVAAVKYAELRIASDDGADAWVNGHQVLSDLSSGHAYSYWNYVVNVTDYVTIGDNTIAVHVNDQGGDNYFDAELYVELELEHPCKAVAWVKIPSLPANTATTIYMYYGGSNPYSSYNNPSKVFMYFDDYSSPDLPPDTFFREGMSVPGTYNISNGVLYMKAWTNSCDSDVYMVINRTMPGDIAIDVRYKWNMDLGSDTSGFFYIELRVLAVNGNNYTYDYQMAEISNGDGIGYGDYGIPGVRLDNNVNGAAYYNNNNQANTWYTVTLRPNIEFPTVAKPSPAPKIQKIYNITVFTGLWCGSGTVESWLDYIRIRPYVDPEPSVSVGSSEQALVSAFVSPTAVKTAAGQTVSFNVTMYNSDNSSAYNVTVRLVDHNNSVRDEANTTVQPQGYSNVTLSAATGTGDIGKHTWFIVGYDTDNMSRVFFNVSVTVDVRPPYPVFELVGVSPSSVTVKLWETDTLQVSVTVRNTGGRDGWILVRLLDTNSTVRAEGNITVPGFDGEETVTLTAVVNETDHGYNEPWSIVGANDTATFFTTGINVTVNTETKLSREVDQPLNATLLDASSHSPVASIEYTQPLRVMGMSVSSAGPSAGPVVAQAMTVSLTVYINDTPVYEEHTGYSYGEQGAQQPPPAAVAITPSTGPQSYPGWSGINIRVNGTLVTPPETPGFNVTAPSLSSPSGVLAVALIAAIWVALAGFMGVGPGSVVSSIVLTAYGLMTGSGYILTFGIVALVAGALYMYLRSHGL